MSRRYKVSVGVQPVGIYIGQRVTIGSFIGTCCLNLFGIILIAKGWNN